MKTTVSLALALLAPGELANGQTLLYSLSGSGSEQNLGESIGAIGDLDGDGHSDLIVGVPDGGPHFDGEVLVVSGATGAILRTHRGLEGEAFGRRVAAGDVDGDGVPDVIVGAPPGSGAIVGRVAIFSGDDGGLLHEFHGDATLDRFGSSVSSADVDGDGFQDVLAGAPTFVAATPGYARAWSGDDGQLLHSWTATTASTLFGWAIAGVGDVDDDGRDDVAISELYDDTAGGDAGAFRVYSGQDGGLLRESFGLGSADQLGYSLRSVGLIDGDDVPEYAVGANGGDYVWLHSGATGAVLHELVLEEGAQGYHQLGLDCDGAGDLDGDGVPDVLVGADGLARVFSGVDGLALASFYMLDTPPTSGALGWSVAGLGDLDDDGIPDLAVAAPFATTAAGNEAGLVRVYAGGSPWTGLLSGGLGDSKNGIPVLEGSGDADPGRVIVLQLGDVPPSFPHSPRPYVLVVGTAIANQPLQGGLLVPTPEVVLAGFVTQPPPGGLGLGGASHVVRPPALLPGQEIVLQAWFPEVGDETAVTASNGLRYAPR